MIAGKELRTVLIGGVLMTVLTAGLARATDANDLKADVDKVSYIIGTQVGSQLAASLKAQSVEANFEALVRGIRDALTGQKSAFSPEEQEKIMTAFKQKLDAKIQEQAMDRLGKGNEWKLKLTKPELMKFDPQKDYFWIMETNKGNIKIKLLPDVAPMHVTSTIFLTGKGFYDGTIFHRVIPSFMAQGGDPLGAGSGGPGYKYDGEFSPNVKHDRPYLLSMANAGPGTDGSQFFLTFAPTPWLDGKHTIFGEVVEGQDTVKKLEAAGSSSGKPTEELKIVKARIEEKAKG
jgi:peptidyl-prolyl cis-trans isomerase B (cyclophilin B)